jgi:hypothetical protein
MGMGTTHRRTMACGASVAATLWVLVGSACGGGVQDQQAASTTRGAAAAGQPAEQAPPQATPQASQPAESVAIAPPSAAVAPASATTPAQVATPLAATPPVASPALVQDHEIGGIQVALVEIRRTSGETVTVKWQYRNTTQQEVKVSKGGTSWADVYQLTADAYLIDAVNKKKYLVIRDAENNWVASKHGDWQGTKLGPGQTMNAWAKFPAPPAGVQKITVNIPGVAPFEDVAIVQ